MEGIEIRIYPYMPNEGNAELLYQQFKYAGHIAHERMTSYEKFNGFILEAFTSTEIVGISLFHTALDLTTVVDAIEVKKDYRGNEYGIKMLQKILEKSMIRIQMRPNSDTQRHKYFMSRGFESKGNEVTMECYSRKLKNFIRDRRKKHGGT